MFTTVVMILPITREHVVNHIRVIRDSRDVSHRKIEKYYWGTVTMTKVELKCLLLRLHLTLHYRVPDYQSSILFLNLIQMNIM